MRSLVSLFCRAILAHQDKQRKENRLQRDDHREQRKGVWIKRVCTAEVQTEPNGKPDEMNDYEPHPAGLGGNQIPQTVRTRPAAQGVFLNLANLQNVPLRG